MTGNEVKIIIALGECRNDFLALPVLHNADIKDFEFHIHALQNIIFMRQAYREYSQEQALLKYTDRGYNVYPHEKTNS